MNALFPMGRHVFSTALTPPHQQPPFQAGMEKIYSSPATPTPPTLATILDSPTLLLINVATVLLIPLWRDIHFYSAHRFLHLRPLYRLVHSLHHRNTDPEPFSGLAMHPVEHL